MKLLIEQYSYDKSRLSALLDPHYYSELQQGKAQIPYVGYFLSHKIPDTVFILPKVFIIDGKAFGKYAPEEIIDFESLEPDDKKTVFALSVWIYRAIKLYCERKRHDVDSTEVMQNVVSHQGTSSQTMIDIVLSLLKFHKDHQNLFTYITRVQHSGQSKIHWQKTISKSQPVIQNQRPVYLQPHTKQKEVNYDEELIVLFFSVLNYLNCEFHFDVRSVFGYELLRPATIRDMIESGKGMRILRQNRRKYFTDDMVRLWNLLFTFFEESQHVQSKTNHDEQAMLVRNFNLVFEDMIDSLIGDNNLPDGLKQQKDGKIIDHIYRQKSLIDDNKDVYFLGDSKYYMDGNKLPKNSIYKQYTYAKNVIQYHIDLFNAKDYDPKKDSTHYLDKTHEGYNITPNFFIRGSIDKDQLSNYSDHNLTKFGDDEISYHFDNRLFDRDTLILQSYNINFLFVLAAYVQGAGEHKDIIRGKFREHVQNVIAERYQFYAMKPIIKQEAEQFRKDNFQDILGKVFAPYDAEKTNCLSLALAKDFNEKSYKDDNDKLLEKLKKYYYVEPIIDNKDTKVTKIDIDPETLFAGKTTIDTAVEIKQLNDLVLVGYKSGLYVDEKTKKSYYYVRIGDAKGSIRVVGGVENAKYLLLYQGNEMLLYNLDGRGPRFDVKESLANQGATPSHNLYLVYGIKDSKAETTIKGLDLDKVKIKVLAKGKGKQINEPFFVTVRELLQSTYFIDKI